MTRAEIVTRMRSFLKDNDSSNQTWVDADLFDFIEDAITDIAVNSKLLRSREAVTAVAGQLAFFDAPAYTISVEDTFYDGEYLPPMSIEEAATFSEGPWESELGSIPVAAIYGPYGALRIRVFPAPETALDVSKLAVNVSRIQTVALATATSPELPKAYHNAVVYGAVVLAYSQDFDMRHPEKALMFIRLQDRVLARVGGSPYADRLPEKKQGEQ